MNLVVSKKITSRKGHINVEQRMDLEKKWNSFRLTQACYGMQTIFEKSPVSKAYRKDTFSDVHFRPKRTL